ncbi:hypothetical protein RRG08_059153 [Elysia crispata]|uniref:Uncharacterized protein n=1 Tax=Elysia crispata TaxID=231223 RepID=A0AAE0ZWU2_9GAST|nr:hypothetical protein RRG08_059153 [Elysia crispata]
MPLSVWRVDVINVVLNSSMSPKSSGKSYVRIEPLRNEEKTRAKVYSKGSWRHQQEQEEARGKSACQVKCNETQEFKGHMAQNGFISLASQAPMNGQLAVST